MIRTITIVLICVATVGLIAWDIVPALAEGSGDTISEVMLGWAWHHPWIPAASGVLCGHLFWPLRAKLDYLNRTAGGMLVYGVVFLLADVGVTLAGQRPTMLPLLPFLPHVVLGHFFWGQAQREPDG